MPSSTMRAISFGWIMSAATSPIMKRAASSAKIQYFFMYRSIQVSFRSGLKQRCNGFHQHTGDLCM